MESKYLGQTMREGETYFNFLNRVRRGIGMPRPIMRPRRSPGGTPGRYGRGSTSFALASRRMGDVDFSEYPNSGDLSLNIRSRGSPSPAAVASRSSAYDYSASPPPAAYQLNFDDTSYVPSAAQQSQLRTSETFQDQIPSGELPTETELPPPMPCETGSEGIDNLETMNESAEDQVLQGLGIENRITKRHMKKAGYFMNEQKRQVAMRGLGQSNPFTDLATQALTVYSQSLAAQNQAATQQANAAKQLQLNSFLASQGGGTPMWTWIIAGVVLIGGGILIMRKGR